MLLMIPWILQDAPGFSRTYTNLRIFCNFEHFLHIFEEKVPIFRKETVKTGKLYDFIFHIFGRFNLKLSS